MSLFKFSIQNPPTINALVVRGPKGETGIPGPNAVTQDTDTNLLGPLFGNDGKVRAATADEVISSTALQAALADYPTETELEAELADIPKATTTTKIQPLFYDRLLNEVPSAQTIPGAEAYAPSYEAKLDGTVSGSSFEVTGGDTLSNFGTGSWAAVLEKVDGELYNCIVTSRTGSSVKITPPASFTGSARLWLRHTSALGQHFAKAGNRAIADDLLRGNFDPLDCIVRLTPKWIHGSRSPSYWDVFNGAPTNFLINQNVANTFGSDAIFNAKSTVTTFARLGNGQGVSLNITLDEETSGECHIVLGHNGPFGDGMLTVSLIVDGVTVASQTNYGFIQKHRLAFNSAKSMTLRIVSTYAAGNVDIKIGDVSVHPPRNSRCFLRSGEKLLIIGDSWTAEASFPGLQSRLEERHDGPIVNVGVGGTQASYALAIESGKRRIDNWLDTHKPNVLLMHYYINDANAGVPRATWAKNILAICDACVSRGVQPVVILPGCTASISQVQGLIQSYAGAFDPRAQLAYPSNCKTLDFTSADSQINRVKKVAGRTVKDSEALRVYVASGSNPSDAWFDVTNPGNIVIPKTFSGALVVLSEMLRFYGCATQNSGTLDDSSSANIDGTASGTIDYATDVFGIARRYFSLGASEYVDCGAAAAIPSLSNWTIGAWARVATIAGQHPILAQATAGDGIALSISDGQPSLYLGASGSYVAVGITGGTIVANRWHHIAARRASNVFTLWLDGVIVATQSDADATRAVASKGNLVGGWGFGLYNTSVIRLFVGDLADVFVANSALSDAEMAWMASNQNYII